MQVVLARPSRERQAEKFIPLNKERFAITETGTGFAGAKLSEVLPSARAARFARMTEVAVALRPSVKIAQKKVDAST